MSSCRPAEVFLVPSQRKPVEDPSHLTRVERTLSTSDADCKIARTAAAAAAWRAARAGTSRGAAAARPTLLPNGNERQTSRKDGGSGAILDSLGQSGIIREPSLRQRCAVTAVPPDIGRRQRDALHSAAAIYIYFCAPPPLPTPKVRLKRNSHLCCNN